MGILDALENYVSGGITRERLAKKVAHRNGSFSPRLFSQQLFRHKQRGDIRQNEDGNFVLDERGRERLLLESLAKIVFQNKKTDGSSRLIIFDIPETKRFARDTLREKLHEFECQQVQRSVYITPYVCENEIREIAKILGVSSHVRVLKMSP